MYIHFAEAIRKLGTHREVAQLLGCSERSIGLYRSGKRLPQLRRLRTMPPELREAAKRDLASLT